MTKYDKRHGGPYDRGRVDSYYRRHFNPHYYVGNTFTSKLVEQKGMTQQEIAEYAQGYNENDVFKDWSED